MRVLGFILTFMFVMCNVSLAGTSDGKLPNVGLFSYSGSPIVADSPVLVAMATR